MAANGEVRVVSYVFPGDVRRMRMAARGAGGRTESVTPRPPTDSIEIVTILPSKNGFTRFQTLVERGSRAARERAAAPPTQRRPRQAAA